MTDTEEAEKATVREVGDLKLEMERRFGRVERTLAVLLAVNLLPHAADLNLDSGVTAVVGGLIAVLAILHSWH